MVKHAILVMALTVGAVAQERGIQTQHYWSLLREQPDNRTLYDRFCTAWLKEQSDEDLKAFFKSQAKSQLDSANRLILALFYERQGQDAEALAVYRQAVAVPTATFLYHKARAEMRALQFETAVNDLIKARALESTAELAMNLGKLLGKLYLRTHQPDKATGLWTQLLRDHPRDNDLYEDLIELQRVEGLYDQALETCDHWLAATTDQYQAVMIQLRQAELWQAKSDVNKALEVYTRALSRVEDGSWLENQICGHIEQALARDSDAQGLRDVIANLVKRYPQRMGLKKRLARLMVQGGETDAALGLFQQILEVTPGDKANQTDYVQTLVEAGRYDQAITLLEQLSKRHPDDREMLITLADLYFKNQQTDRIGAVLDRFLDRSDKSENVYLRIGGLLETYELVDRASPVYQAMIERWADSLTAQLAYGEFLYRTDHHQEALARFADIAAKGDLQMLMRVCNSVATRDHDDLALKWAEARFTAFSDNSAYLSYLCKMAMRVSAFDKAVAWARQQLSLARTYADMRVAIAQVQAAAGEEAAQAALVRELEGLRQPTIQETCLLSQLLEAQGNPVGADRVIAAAESAHPEIAMQQQILLYRQRQNWNLAAERMEALIRRVGTRDDTHIRDLIEFYHKSRRYTEGIEWVLRWKQQSPGHTQAWIWHAKLLRDQGKADEAIDVLTQADRRLLGHVDILTALAATYGSMGQHADVQRIYWRLYDAAEDGPAKLRWVPKIGAAGEKLGTHEAVIDTFLAQKKRQPTAVLPLLALAELYKQAGRPGEQRQVLAEAAHLQTDDLPLLLELAQVQERLGHWQQAVETLTRALPLDQTKETKLKMARLHIENGQQDKGLSLLFDLAGAQTMGADDALAIARTIATTKDWGAVIHFLERVLPAHPADYSLHYVSALALEEVGRTEEALEAFIDLLSMKKERPGHAPGRFKLPWIQHGIVVDIALILPAEAVDLLTMCHWHARIYPFRQSRQAVALAIPNRVEDVTGYAVSHIVTLSESLGPQHKQQIQADLLRCGVANAEILLNMEMRERRRLGGISQPGPDINRLVQMYPDNQAVQAIWIVHRIDMGGCSLEEAKRVFDLLEKDCPRLALIIGLLCHGPREVVADLFTKSYEQLKHVTDLDYYEVTAIAFALQQNSGKSTMALSQRRHLEQRLLTWFSSPQTTGAARRYMFPKLCTLFTHHNDLGNYIHLLEQVVSAQTPLSGYRGGPSLNRAFIAPFTYPPDYLPGFSREVYNELKGQDNKKKVERLKRQLTKVHDPLLKLMIAMCGRDDRRVPALVREIMETNHPSLPAHCLAASVAIKAGRLDEALTLLDKAQYLPMAPSDQVVIDATMVGIVADLEQSRDGEIVDLGKKAALRLKAAPLTVVQTQELIIAMEALGIADPAAQLGRQVIRVHQGPPVQGAVGSNNRRAIERFLEKGRQDWALRLIAQQMHTTLGMGSPTHTSLSYLRERAQPYLDIVTQHRMKDALLAAADPGAGSDADALTAYALTCELFQETSKAMAIYERIISQDPQQARAHLRLVVLDAQPSRRLLKVPAACMGQVGAGLALHVEEYCRQGQRKEARACVDAVMVYLDQVQDSMRATLGWVDSLAGSLAKEQSSTSAHLYQKSSSIPRSLYRPVRRPSQNKDKSLPINEREELHTLLCKRMLAEPYLAVSGFTRMAAVTQASGILISSSISQAHQAMQGYQPPAKTAPGVQPSYMQPRYQHDHVKLACPAMAVIDHAQHQQEPDSVSDAVIVPLRRKGMHKQADYVQALLDVAQAPGDQFFVKADPLLARFVQPAYIFWPVMTNHERICGFVIDVYIARGLSRDTMSNYLLDKIREDLAANQNRHAHAVEYWVNHLMRRDRVGAKSLLESVVALYNCPNGRLWRVDQGFQRSLASLEKSRTRERTPRERTRPSPTRRITLPRRIRR
jgi:tetratricopeptide (TPR) repeat protein